MAGGQQHLKASPDKIAIGNGDMRARDVRFYLKPANIDPRVMYVLEAFAEKLHMIDKGLGQVVLLVDQMADITKNYVGVAERMKQTIDGIRDAAGDPTLGMLSTSEPPEVN